MSDLVGGWLELPKKKDDGLVGGWLQLPKAPESRTQNFHEAAGTKPPRFQNGKARIKYHMDKADRQSGS